MTTPDATWTPEKYAEQLAVFIQREHYPEVPQFVPMAGDIMGLLSQIDNMVTGLVRAPAPPKDEGQSGWWRHRAAKLVAVRIWTKDSRGSFRYGPETRVALALAAADVRRGRPLTEAEQLENLRKALAESPDEDAHEAAP